MKEPTTEEDMRTYEVYTRIDGRLKFRGHRSGQANAEAYVRKLIKKHPDAEVWCAPMCPHDDPALIW